MDAATVRKVVEVTDTPIETVGGRKHKSNVYENRQQDSGAADRGSGCK